MLGSEVGVGKHDEGLAELLDNGLGPQFEGYREEALRMLESEDIAGFWLQAAGTGRQLARVHDQTPPNPTQHDVMHVAGYADEFHYRQVASMARFLCGHHFAVSVDPASGDPETTGSQLLELFWQDAERTYSGLEERVQYPEPVSLSRRQKQARELLKHEELTFAWLQVVPNRQSVREHLHVDATPDTSEWSPREDAVGIESLLCSPSKDPHDYELMTRGQFLIQHLFVGARTAELSLEMFAEQVRPVMLNSRALYTDVNPL
jgi:hypothetical protein